MSIRRWVLGALLALVPAAGAAADLGWLAGAWSGGERGQRWDAYFTDAGGGVVLGTWKQYDAKGALTFEELQRFDARGKQLTLLLVANGGTPYTLKGRAGLKILELSGERAFPRTVRLALDPAGVLTLTLDGKLRNTLFAESFPMRRAGAPASPHATIPLPELKRELAARRAVLVDVRERDEWAAGHLAGAQLLPLSAIKADAARAAKLLPAGVPVYLHCRSGKRCVAAAELLAPHGRDVRPLAQGFEELSRNGFAAAR
jgi:phage shock protein E